MWCKLCQQDVPATASPDSGKLSCPRCRTTLRADLKQREASPAEGSLTSTADSPADSTPANELPLCDTWELEEQLRHLERILQPHLTIPSAASTAKPLTRSRIDTPHVQLARRHKPGPRKLALAATREPSDEGSLMTPAWFCLALGLMMGSCGGMLWVWSLVMERPELWSVGMPIAVAGQVTLLLGLVLQLDRLRRQHRHTSAQLEQVDEQLHDLKKRRVDRAVVAAQHRVHRSAASSSDPLLTGLKDQLNQLAARIEKLND